MLRVLSVRAHAHGIPSEVRNLTNAAHVTQGATVSGNAEQIALPI